MSPAASRPGALPAPIETERLRLAPFAESDVEAVHAIWSEIDVRQHLWDGRIPALERVREIQAGSDEGFAKGEFGLWVARLSGKASPIGLAGYWPYHEPVEIELMYSIDRAHWGTGLAYEMASRLLRYGFEELDLPVVQASLDAPNERSAKLAMRLGLQRFEHPRHPSEAMHFYRLERPAL